MRISRLAADGGSQGSNPFQTISYRSRTAHVLLRADRARKVGFLECRVRKSRPLDKGSRQSLA